MSRPFGRARQGGTAVATAAAVPASSGRVASSGPAVRFADVSKVFGSRKDAHTALERITLDVRRGAITGIIGYSGAGKSTLVRLVNALELPSSGSVVVEGTEVTALSEAGLRSLRGGIGMIFQQFNLFNARSVAANVEYPLRLAGWERTRRKARVAELLEFVGLAEKARARPMQLSGGQKQRVGIARALATGPSILLADEATSALDPETTSEVLELLGRINSELGTTILVITHEMHVVRTLCHDVAVLERGRLLEAGPVYDVFSAPSNEASRRFIDSTLQDRPSQDTVQRLLERHDGRLVTVGVVDGADGARLDVAEEAATVGGVRAEVVYGSVTEIDHRPFGALSYVLRGDDAAVEAVVRRLRSRGDVVDWGSGRVVGEAAAHRLGGTA